MPDDIPVTTPVDDPIDIAEAKVLHKPPGTPSDSVIVAPIQTVDNPVIAVGVGFTVMDLVAGQPATV